MNELLSGGMNTVILVAQVLFVVWALVGAVLCARASSGAFVAAGKWNKWGWFAVCVGAALVFWLTSPFSIFGVVGIVAVGVFFADVRPSVSSVSR